MTHYRREPLIICDKNSDEIERFLRKQNSGYNLDHHSFPKNRHSLRSYEALAIYHLVKLYNYPDNEILEIGTGTGYTTAVLSKACPKAKITTLEPSVRERLIAQKTLSDFDNIRFNKLHSWDYYDEDKNFDVILVDGDTKHIEKDLIWWLNLNYGGMMLFRHYSEKKYPHVYHQLNRFVLEMGLLFDVIITDENNNGLVGLYK